MICPVCKNLHMAKRVLRTRQLENGCIERKRLCGHCKAIYYTLEQIEANEREVVEILSEVRKVV
jgi:transcriptional regulator NrdR family protein